MRTRWLAAVATLALLLLPLASAAEAGPFAALTVSKVEAPAGLLKGPLAGATWYTPRSQAITGQATGIDPGSLPNATYLMDRATGLVATAQGTSPRVGSPGEVPLPWLAVEARHARIAIYEAVTTDGAPSSNPSREPAAVLERTDLRIAGDAVGDEDSARLLVMPAGDAASEARVGGPLAAESTRDGTPGTGSRTGANFDIDLTKTAKVRSTAGGPVEVSGSFRIVVDSVDVPFTSAQESSAIQTRTTTNGLYAYYGGTSQGVGYTVRTAVIDLWDATLVLGSGELFVRAATLAVPSLDLEASGGQVAGQDVGAATVHAEGDLGADLAVTESSDLQVSLSGALSQLAVGGQDVALPSAVTANDPSGSGSSGLFALLLLAIPAIPAAQWAAGRRRFTQMDRALDRGDFETALRLSARFTPWPGQRQDGVLAAAICLIALDRADEACQRLEARRFSASRRPMRDFLRARGHAALGDTEAATRALAASLLAEPALVAQARTDPVLSSLVAPKNLKSSQEAYA